MSSSLLSSIMFLSLLRYASFGLNSSCDADDEAMVLNIISSKSFTRLNVLDIVSADYSSLFLWVNELLQNRHNV